MVEKNKLKPVIESKTKVSAVSAVSAAATNEKRIKKKTTKKKESCKIESTKNSVRVSFLFKQQSKDYDADPLEVSILYQLMRFLSQGAEESYQILRKKPLEGYSVSFLITNKLMKQNFNNNDDQQIQKLI